MLKLTEISFKNILSELKEIDKSLKLLIKQLLKYLLHLKEYLLLSPTATLKKMVQT